jgi:hypothetical protein
MPDAMTPEDVRELLEELATRLNDAGITAGIRVVGGAALSTLDNSRRATSDIDAVIVPAGVAADIVTDLANERGLPSDWLNDAVLAYIPPVGPEDWVEVIRRGDVRVSIGSVHMLLAMKLRANRGVRDSDDIAFLLGACDVRTLDDAQDIYQRYHAQDAISPSATVRSRPWPPQIQHLVGQFSARKHVTSLSLPNEHSPL